jgi:hypothetical protein
MRRLAALVITMIAMYNTIKNMFEGARGIDYTMLVVETLVLLLVGYGEWVTFSDHRKANKRHKFLTPKRIWLAGLIERGEQLRQNAPVEMETREEHPDFQLWVNRVDEWSNRTGEAIGKESLIAIVVFNQTHPCGLGSVFVQTPNQAGKPLYISNQDVLWAYQRLVSQLANLTRIKDNADLYFDSASKPKGKNQ